MSLEDKTDDELYKERNAIDYELLVRAIVRKGDPEYFQSDAYEKARSEAILRGLQ